MHQNASEGICMSTIAVWSPLNLPAYYNRKIAIWHEGLFIRARSVQRGYSAIQVACRHIASGVDLS